VFQEQELMAWLLFVTAEGCRPGLCGQEAACHPLGNKNYTCVCPHDGSEPTKDLKCPNRMTGM